MRAITFSFLIIIFGFVTQQTFAQESIFFSQTGLKTALTEAKINNKPVMLWCYASWCPHCKFMREHIFNDTSVAGYFNNNFICVSQDMENDDGTILNEKLKIHAFPTFVFYNSSGEIVYRVEGELKATAFLEEGKNALNPKKQFPYLKQQYEKNTRNSENCFNYIRALKKGGINVSEIANQYFNTQNDYQLLSEVNWMIFTNGITDINSRVFRFVIAHQKEYAAISSPERVKRKFDYEVKSLLNPLVEALDTINYPEKRKLALQIHSFGTDSLVFNYDLMLYSLTQNWKMYFETCNQSVEKFAWKNSSQLNDILRNIIDYSTDIQVFKPAENWAKRMLDLDKSYDNYLQTARLYQKLNKIAEAIQMAQNADNLATKFGWKGEEAEKLILELKKESAL